MAMVLFTEVFLAKFYETRKTTNNWRYERSGITMCSYLIKREISCDYEIIVVDVRTLT